MKTTRRGLFGWLASGVAALAGRKSAPAASVEPIVETLVCNADGTREVRVVVTGCEPGTFASVAPLWPTSGRVGDKWIKSVGKSGVGMIDCFHFGVESNRPKHGHIRVSVIPAGSNADEEVYYDRHVYPVPVDELPYIVLHASYEKGVPVRRIEK